MKKILIIILTFVSLTGAAQYKIYSPTRIYGYLWLNSYTTLPASTGNELLAVSRDTLWIDSGEGWVPLWPATAQGILEVPGGGTGQTSYTIGDILFASGAATLSKLSDVATGNALVSGGVGVAPIWSKIGLTTHVNGILPVANGGTGVNDGLIPSLVDTNTTVNGHKLSANVTVTKADVGLGNATDESKATMFTNSAFTGIPTATTASPGTNNTQIATTAFVVANLPNAAQIYTQNVTDTGKVTTNSSGVVEITATGGIIINDSVYFPYMIPPGTGTRFYVPTSTGAMDTGTLVNARVGLTKRLGLFSFFIHFLDRSNGEMKYYWEDGNGKLHSQYGLKGLGLEGIQAIAINVELVMRWMFRQWIFIILLIVWCVRLEFKLRRR